jgi:IS5 family transposase
VTDDLGRPLVMASSPGQTSDFRLAKQCLAALPPVQEVIADKGYDSNKLRNRLRQRASGAGHTSSHMSQEPAAFRQDEISSA